MYEVAGASEYLVITGGWIEDMKLTRNSWVFPGQRCTRIDLSPVNYPFQVEAMSADKLPFILPAVFTIGPREDDRDSLLKYARLMSSHDTISNHVTELVAGVIEGETRVVAASMTMEDISKATKQFKQELLDKVQLQLNHFGLLIYNANLKQHVDVQGRHDCFSYLGQKGAANQAKMKQTIRNAANIVSTQRHGDEPGHDYYSYLGQKVQMGAANQARIAVAESKMKDEVGAKLRYGQNKQNAAKNDAETKILCSQRHGKGKKREFKVETNPTLASGPLLVPVAVMPWMPQLSIAKTISNGTLKLKIE